MRISHAEYDIACIKQLRSVCPTRWFVRVPNIQALVQQFTAMLNCLNNLSSISVREFSLRTQLSKSYCRK